MSKFEFQVDFLEKELDKVEVYDVRNVCLHVYEQLEHLEGAIHLLIIRIGLGFHSDQCAHIVRFEHYRIYRVYFALVVQLDVLQGKFKLQICLGLC